MVQANIVAISKDQVSGLWQVEFEVFSYLMGVSLAKLTSVAVFDTEDAARAGGERAIAEFAATSKFPNVCEVF